jgi:glycosyltransferase involved in cell wall biosynthesis
VAATTYEETSLAALEAVASGTPCVLTRQCEITVLNPGGGIVTECDPAAFAEGLSAVLTDPHRADRARFARERILTMETAEHRAQAYAELFSSIVNNTLRRLA